jgi:hypothetical protein
MGGTLTLVFEEEVRAAFRLARPRNGDLLKGERC